MKFLHKQKFNELIMYLEAILKSINTTANKDDLQPQRMLLYTWIVELKLNQINSLQAQQSSITNANDMKAAEEEIALKKRTFHEFLKVHAGGLGQAGHETVF